MCTEKKIPVQEARTTPQVAQVFKMQRSHCSYLVFTAVSFDGNGRAIFEGFHKNVEYLRLKIQSVSAYLVVESPLQRPRMVSLLWFREIAYYCFFFCSYVY